MDWKIDDLNPILSKITKLVAAIKFLRFALFKCIFLNKKVWNFKQFSLKFVPIGPINNKSALVQIMAWRQSDDKPLSEPTGYVDGMPTSEVTPVTIWYIRPPHHGHTSQYYALTLTLQGQGHWCGLWARSYSRPSIILTHFLFISHQSDQQLLRYSYFEIWTWNIQGQGHEWGQRSRWHIIPSIQPMHFLFVSHQKDQPIPEIWPK